MDDNYIACISGKNLIMKQQKANQLFVFKREKKAVIDNPDEPYEFKQIKRVVVKDMPEFDKVCMQFYFKLPEAGSGEISGLYFVKSSCIMELDWTTEVVKDTYTFKRPLARQPEFF